MADSIPAYVEGFAQGLLGGASQLPGICENEDHKRSQRLLEGRASALHASVLVVLDSLQLINPSINQSSTQSIHQHINESIN